MNKNMENECKVLLDSEDYNKIFEYFHLDKLLPIKQVNYYFDTNNFNLAHNKYNLRVRHILEKDIFTLTVKIPQVDGSNLEINEDITFEAFKELIENNSLPNGFIKEKIDEFNDEKIILFASLLTTRYEFEYNSGLIALDYNEYNGRYDYELEFEGMDMEHSKYVITNLLDSLNIEFKFSNISKRKRAIESRL